MVNIEVKTVVQVLKLIEHIEQLKRSVGIAGSLSEIMGAEKKEVQASSF